MKSRRKNLRLLTVVAMVTAVMVPATLAGAQPPYYCNGVMFDASNPAHVLYGDGTEFALNKVDLSAAPSGRTVFWNYKAAAGWTIIGSDFDDVICGTTQNDIIKGKKGNDIIFGNGSATFAAGTPKVGEQLHGNAGNDTIYNGGFHVAGTALLGGAPSAATKMPNTVAAWLFGGSGADTIYTGAVADIVKGGPGDDTLNAKDFGVGAGAKLYGNKGDDLLIAGAGDGTELYGGVGADTLYGGGTFDPVTGSNQKLFGGPGPDELIAGGGAGQHLRGNRGRDTISNVGAGSGQMAWGGQGNDEITGKATGVVGSTVFGFTAFGGLGDDVIKGGPGADMLFGGDDPNVGGFVQNANEGDDVIWGGKGADTINGGTGNNVMFGNMPSVLTGLDTPDGAQDVMTAKSGLAIPAGPPGPFGAPGTPAVPATSNTFYGSCAKGDVDMATDIGTGTTDSAFNTGDNTGIENVTNACVYVIAVGNALVYNDTGWAGHSCPDGYAISSATAQKGPGVAADHPYNLYLWKPGASASTPTVFYPNTPFGHVYGAGEEGAIVQNGGKAQTLQIVNTCVPH